MGIIVISIVVFGIAVGLFGVITGDVPIFTAAIIATIYVFFVVILSIPIFDGDSFVGIVRHNIKIEKKHGKRRVETTIGWRKDPHYKNDGFSLKQDDDEEAEYERQMD